MARSSDSIAKAALKSLSSLTNWVQGLPIDMLGIRTALKEDLGCITAELVYGTTVLIPGEFFSAADVTADPASYVVQL